MQSIIGYLNCKLRTGLDSLYKRVERVYMMFREVIGMVWDIHCTYST
jgi:hypothetical protein